MRDNPTTVDSVIEVGFDRQLFLYSTQ